MYVFGQKVEIPEMKRTSHIFPFLPVKTGNKSEINVTFFRNRNFRISHLTLERVYSFAESFAVYILFISVLPDTKIKPHKISYLIYAFIQEKSKPSLTFNPGLARLTTFRTTGSLVRPNLGIHQGHSRA